VSSTNPLQPLLLIVWTADNFVIAIYNLGGGTFDIYLEM